MEGERACRALPCSSLLLVLGREREGEGKAVCVREEEGAVFTCPPLLLHRSVLYLFSPFSEHPSAAVN